MVITSFIRSFVIRFSPIHRYTIAGESMLPTLHPGKNVLVNRLAYLIKQPQKGEIVAVKKTKGGDVIIKRISRVEDKEIFVLGDNTQHSTDSRKFGMLEKEI